MPIVENIDNYIIEVFRHKFQKILGIQWHLERVYRSIKSKSISDNLIKDFIRVIEVNN